jgi:hypothetical protein
MKFRILECLIKAGKKCRDKFKEFSHRYQKRVTLAKYQLFPCDIVQRFQKIVKQVQMEIIDILSQSGR